MTNGGGLIGPTRSKAQVRNGHGVDKLCNSIVRRQFDYYGTGLLIIFEQRIED